MVGKETTTSKARIRIAVSIMVVTILPLSGATEVLPEEPEDQFAEEIVFQPSGAESANLPLPGTDLPLAPVPAARGNPVAGPGGLAATECGWNSAEAEATAVGLGAGVDVSARTNYEFKHVSQSQNNKNYAWGYELSESSGLVGSKADAVASNSLGKTESHCELGDLEETAAVLIETIGCVADGSDPVAGIYQGQIFTAQDHEESYFIGAYSTEAYSIPVAFDATDGLVFESVMEPLTILPPGLVASGLDIESTYELQGDAYSCTTTVS